MARLVRTLLCLILSVQSFALHATLTSAQARKLARLKRQCEDEGNGKACYDYGRGLWSTPGAIDRKKAKHYLYRACELKYQTACVAYNERNHTSSKLHHKTKTIAEADSNPCFKKEDLALVRLTPFSISPTLVRGQQLENIKESSFWARAGFQNSDVLVKVNNLPVNTPEETLKAFATAGKALGFEIQRNGQTMTLWSTCQ